MTSRRSAGILRIMSAFAGRDQELAWLRAQLGNDAACVVLVSGTAGLGKTRLVSEALGDAPGTWLTFPQARFRAPAHGLRTLAGLPGAAQRALTEELDEPAHIDLPTKVEAICVAANQVLRELQPPLLVLDDVQWADDLTLAWLAQLPPTFISTAGKLVLIVRAGSGRAGELAEALLPLEQAGLLRRHELLPLDDGAMATLLRATSPAADPLSIVSIIRAANGVPVVAEALAASIGSDRPARGGVAAGGTTSLMARVIRERLAELTDAARGLVLTAALTTQPASEDIVRTSCTLVREGFDAALAEVVEHGLLEPPRAGLLSFPHELYREAVVAVTPLPQVRAGHLALAAAIAAAPAPPAEQVADHLLEGGDARAAMSWLVKAAEDAGVGYDEGEAFATAMTGLNVACSLRDEEATCELAERLTAAARSIHRTGEARPLLDTAVAAVSRPSARARVLVAHAALVSATGDYEARNLDLRTAVALLTSDEPQLLALALGELAYPAGEDVTYEDRVAAGRRGLQLATECGDARTTAICATSLAQASLYGGDISGIEIYELARSAAESPGPGPRRHALLRRLYANWMYDTLLCGRYAAAQEVLARAREISIQPYATQLFLAFDALLWWRTGAWDRAGAAARSVRSEPLHPITPIATCVAVALEHEAGSADLRPLSPITKHRAIAEQVLANSLLVTMRAGNGEPNVGRGLPRLAQMIAATRLRFGWEDLALAAARAGPRDYSSFLSTVEDLRPVGDRAAGVLLHAQGVGVRDNPTLAQECLQAAAEEYERLGEPYGLATALEDLGRSLAEAGLRPGDVRRRAASIYADLGADRSLARLLRASGGTPALREFRVPPSQRGAGTRGLTPRERQVAELARRGLRAAEIGERLGIAPRTAYNTLVAVRSKLGLSRTADLVRHLSDFDAD